MKIKKVQKKIAKYTKKLEKYLDLLAELTAAKEIVAEAAMEKAKIVMPDKPAEAPAAEPVPVEATPAEQPKPTRRRRVMSAKKSVADVATAEQSKPTRRRRTTSAKKAVVEPVPEEATVEQSKPIRRRRVTSAKEPTSAEQPSKRTPAKKPERASFVLYNCDEEKSPESKYNRNDETFKDSQLGRRGLWNKLKTEIAEGRIELLDGYPIRNVRLDIQSGDPVSVSQRLKFGVIEKV